MAKSFQEMEQICEPYMSAKKWYVQVRHPKTGNVRTVRWYTEEEYNKLYPEEKKENADSSSTDRRNQRVALGFGETEDAYITIFKGDVSFYDEYFQNSPARYCVWWGWYLPYGEEVMTDLPSSIAPIQLRWTEVATGRNLKPEHQLKSIVDSLLYEENPSQHIGKVGDRIELDLTIVKVATANNNYGTLYIYTFVDPDRNQYIWATNSQSSWTVGEFKEVRATIKDHTTNKNIKQTILTRVMERK